MRLWVMGAGYLWLTTENEQITELTIKEVLGFPYCSEKPRVWIRPARIIVGERRVSTSNSHRRHVLPYCFLFSAH